VAVEHLAERFAGLELLDHLGDERARRARLETLAHAVQAFEDRNARADDRRELRRERDQLLGLHRAPTGRRGRVDRAHLAQREAAALEVAVESELALRARAAAHRQAGRVDGHVLERLHAPSSSRY
jgi:hypothetical protein